MKPLIKQTFVLAQNTDSTSEHLLTDDSELHLLGYRSSTAAAKARVALRTVFLYRQLLGKA